MEPTRLFESMELVVSRGSIYIGEVLFAVVKIECKRDFKPDGVLVKHSST